MPKVGLLPAATGFASLNLFAAPQPISASPSAQGGCVSADLAAGPVHTTVPGTAVSDMMIAKISSRAAPIRKSGPLQLSPDDQQDRTPGTDIYGAMLRGSAPGASDRERVDFPGRKAGAFQAVIAVYQVCPEAGGVQWRQNSFAVLTCIPEDAVIHWWTSGPYEFMELADGTRLRRHIGSGAGRWERISG